MSDKLKIIFTFILLMCVIANNAYDNEEYHNHETEFGEFLSINNEVEAPCIFDITDGGRICNCGFQNEEMVLPKMGGNIFQVRVLNCKSLRIKNRTFANLSSVARVSFTNIENLILESNSLMFPLRRPSNRVQLEFMNTIIEEMASYIISGNIDVIKIENCRIGLIRAFSITGLIEKAFKIIIKDSIINRLEPQAFKKFAVDQFLIESTSFISYIPSRAIYDLEVNDIFSISHSNFTSLFSGAFILQDVNSFRLQHNRFNQLHGASLQMKIKESISIEHNTINELSSTAFLSIELDRNYFTRHSEPLEFEFISNTVEINDRPSIITFSPLFKMKISKLYFIKPLSCSRIEEINNNFFKEHADTIYLKTMDTVNINDGVYYTFSYISNHICVTESYLLYIIVGVIILIIILIVVLVVFILIYLRKRRARKLNIVQPEGKTYRETQIVMQIENAGLLKTDL